MSHDQSMDMDPEEMEGIDMQDDDLEEPNMFWSQTLTEGENDMEPPSAPGLWIRITGVSFGAQVQPKSRSVVLLKDEEGKESPVAVLLQGSHEFQSVNLLLNMPFTLVLQGSKVSPVTLSGHLEVPPPQFEEDDGMDFEDVDDEDEQEAALRERLLGKKRSLQQMKAETEKPTKGKKQASKEAEEEATTETGKAEEDEAPALVEEAKESQEDEPPTKKRKTEGSNGDKKSPTGGSQEAKSPQEQGAGKGKGKKNKDWVTMKNGLKFRDMKVGTGQPIRNGQRAGVFYVGQLPDKSVFDKKLSEPAFEFTLGKGDVIKGWDQGVKGMKVGGKRRLEVPPSLGYGAEGTDGIPPNSTLTFTVELKKIS